MLSEKIEGICVFSMTFISKNKHFHRGSCLGKGFLFCATRVG